VLAKKHWLLLLMAVSVLVFGVATSGASLTAQKVLVRSAKPSRVRQQQHRFVDVQRLRHLRAATWRWQTTMGTRRSAVAVWPRTVGTLRSVRRAARSAYLSYLNPPHKRQWLCIHRYEGSWSDSGDPYWGGLQMDRSFMEGYAPHHLLRRGFANHWSPLEQMWVAERAYRSGRGFYAWPNTARACGLI
jgi:hypothetical protein